MSSRSTTMMHGPRPCLASVGTACPEWQYSQEQIADLLSIPEGIGRRLFRGSGIATRNLYLRPTAEGVLPEETQSDLLRRHRRGALELGRRAIERCLSPLEMDPSNVDLLCCVTSTGFMLPGMSAMYVRHLGFRDDVQRFDIVGMGCNAALNGLNAAASWASANPGRHALVVCCEVNSAIYVQDERIVTAVANCLFGDGCGAALVTTAPPAGSAPELIAFSSQVLPDAWRAISYDWSPDHNKFELYLDKDIPAVLGAHSPTALSALLDACDLRRSDIAHWLVHAGGKKVVSAVAEANGLSDRDLRHASDVLRRHGNMGSTTVLFSYSDLIAEGVVRDGDYGVMMTMGPGVTIETALLTW